MTRPQFRVISFDDPGSGPTLSDLFGEILQVKQADWDARTVAEYRATLNVWTALMDPVAVSDISEDTIAIFSQRVAARPGRRGPLSRNTIRKHLRHLRCLLRELGPRRNGRGLGYLAEAPYIKMPAPIRRPIVAFTTKQLSALIAAADYFVPGDGATGDVPPAQWWRTLLIVLWNTAWRISTALNLRWDWLSEDGWTAVPAAYLKGKRVGRRFYLNQPARRAVEPCVDSPGHVSSDREV